MNTLAKLLSPLAASLALIGTVSAAPISDPIGDFLPTFIGTKGADLDVVRADVTLVGNSSFLFFGQLNGTIGTTAGGFYVFGLNRGAGTERFNSGITPVGAGVFFDSVVVIRPDGTGTVNLLGLGGGATPFSGVTIAGDTFSINLPVTLFPTQGFSFANYGWNLWPRNGVGLNTQISDFAPDASTPRVDRVPIPGTASLLALGGLMAAGFMRRRKSDA